MNHAVDLNRLLKLRLIVARHGEMDGARWWNTNGVLGSKGIRNTGGSKPCQDVFERHWGMSAWGVRKPSITNGVRQLFNKRGVGFACQPSAASFFVLKDRLVRRLFPGSFNHHKGLSREERRPFAIWLPLLTKPQFAIFAAPEKCPYFVRHK